VFEERNLWRPHATVDAEGVNEDHGFPTPTDLVDQTGGRRACAHLGSGGRRYEKQEKGKSEQTRRSSWCRFHVSSPARRTRSMAGPMVNARAPSRGRWLSVP